MSGGIVGASSGALAIAGGCPYSLVVDEQTPEQEPDTTSSKASARLLVELRLGGPYLAHRHYEGPVSADGERQVLTRTMKLLPGINAVDRDEFERLAPKRVKGKPAGKMTGLQARIAKNEIVVLERPWSSLPAARCIEIVKRSSDIALLRELLEVEQRDAVADALRRQIGEIVGPLDLGAARRAHGMAG